MVLDVRAVLFDKDGTLVDFDGTWGPAAGQVMRRLCGDDAAMLLRLQEVSQFIADEQRFHGTSPLVAGSSAQYGALWAEVLHRPFDAALLHEIDTLFIEEGLHYIAPIGRPVDALARLASLGMPLGIATNDSELNAHRQADALGLKPYLTAVYGYNSGHGGKPAPGMLLAFAELTGLPPSAIALVGDTRHDLDAARNAGARAILVRSGPEPVEPFENEADLVVDDIHALADFFEAQAVEARAGMAAAG